MCRENLEKQREHTDFCQEPSDRYLEFLEACNGDPRVVAGLRAMRDLETTGGWMPMIDARDARVVKSEK